MKVEAKHLGVINFALKTKVDERGQVVARQIELDEQGAALEVINKIKGLVKDDKFTDGEIELSTEAKALVLKLIKRPWGVDDLEAKVEVEALLK